MSFRIAISLSTCKRKKKDKSIIKQLAAWADLKPACYDTDWPQATCNSEFTVGQNASNE